MLKFANNKVTACIFLTLVILLFIKVDYRFKEIYPGGAQDDSSYYYHAQTIGIDKDFDYTNQLNGNYKDAYIRSDGLPVPRQSIGPGFLAAPFLYLSNIFSKFISTQSNISINYFIYSFVSCFYLYLSLYFLKKIVKISKITDMSKLCIFIFGSGVTYYAFERFSMSAIYEFFSVCLILYLSHIIYNLKTLKYMNLSIFILPVAQFLMLMNRWNNYHLFLIPILYTILNNKKFTKISQNIYFYLGNVTGLSLFLFHTKLVYGEFIYSQKGIYPTSGWVVGERLEKFLQFENLLENIAISFKYLFITSFSMEFGIFYFSAIIFSGLFFLITYLYQRKFKLFFLLSVYYLIPFLPILIFENHGTSYGFRYLFTIIPINILVFFKDFIKNKFINYYLYVFSIFGILSQLFFETTALASLSETTIINSFNSKSPYSNPNYLSGVLDSFLVPSAYLKIIFTSFLGVLVLKCINLFTVSEDLIENYYTIDQQLADLLSSIDSYSWGYLFLVILLIYASIDNLLYDKKG